MIKLCPSVCLSVYLSVYLSVCLSVYLSVCLSVRLSIHLSVCLSVCPSVCLSIHLSVCLSKNSWKNIEYFHLLTFVYLNMSMYIFLYDLSDSFLVLAKLCGMWVYLLFTYWFWTKQNMFGTKTMRKYCEYNRILCSLSRIVNYFFCLNIFS